MIFSTRRARPTPKPSPVLLSATRSTSSPAASPQNKPRSSANRTATSLISRPRSVRPPPTRPPFGSRSLLPVSPLPGADSGLWCRSCPSLCGHGGVIHLCARPMLTVLVSPIRTPPPSPPPPHTCHTLAGQGIYQWGRGFSDGGQASTRAVPGDVDRAVLALIAVQRPCRPRHSPGAHRGEGMRVLDRELRGGEGGGGKKLFTCPPPASPTRSRRHRHVTNLSPLQLDLHPHRTNRRHPPSMSALRLAHSLALPCGRPRSIADGRAGRRVPLVGDPASPPSRRPAPRPTRLDRKCTVIASGDGDPPPPLSLSLSPNTHASTKIGTHECCWRLACRSPECGPGHLLARRQCCYIVVAAHANAEHARAQGARQPVLVCRAERWSGRCY